MLAAQFVERQAHFLTHAAHDAESGFDRNGVALDEHGPVQRKEGVVDFKGLLQVTGFERLPHGSHAPGGNVGRDRDNAAAAHAPQGEGGEVIAGEDGEAFGAALHHFGTLLHAARGFLDAHDVGEVAGEAADGLGKHVAAGAAGHVVGHDGQVNSLRHGGVMLIEAFLRGVL